MPAKLEDRALGDHEVLIIGGTGYIGSRLYQKLTKEGFKVDIIGMPGPYQNHIDNFYKINILNFEELEEFFKKKSYNYIFHFAALIDVKDSIENPMAYYEVNGVGTLNIMESIRRYQEDARLVFNSTGLVYGNTSKLPIDEETTVNPNNPYSSSKYVAEEIIKTYSQIYNINSIVLRLFTVYGPHQRSNMFIPAFIRRCLFDTKIKIGNVQATRDYIYINDLISLLEKTVTMQNIKNFDIFNVASGKEYKISDIADLILKYTNRKKEDLIVDQSLIRDKKAEVSRIWVNIDKVKKTFSWEPIVPIEEGIKKTVESFIEK